MLCWRKQYFVLLASAKFSIVSSSTFLNTSLIVSPRDSSGWGWDSGSSTGSHSFFDIALTALAFMSFGIFLLNLLMNALFLTTTQGLTSTGPIITTGIETATGGETTVTDAPPGPETEGASTLIYIRKKRAALELIVDRPSAANDLAATVLKSIDAMIEKHECLPKVYCDANRQAQVVGHGFQYLMPIYSFFSSFMGEKFGLHKNMPEHLDAILYGVTESNCRSQFSQCLYVNSNNY